MPLTKKKRKKKAKDIVSSQLAVAEAGKTGEWALPRPQMVEEAGSSSKPAAVPAYAGLLFLFITNHIASFYNWTKHPACCNLCVLLQSCLLFH